MNDVRKARREYQRDIENSDRDYAYYLRNKERYQTLEHILIGRRPYNMERLEQYIKDIDARENKLKSYGNRCDISYVNWMTETYERVKGTLKFDLADFKNKIDWIRSN